MQQLRQQSKLEQYISHELKKECAVGTFSRRGAVASATIYHCAECDNIFYGIGNSIGISYSIKNRVFRLTAETPCFMPLYSFSLQMSSRRAYLYKLQSSRHGPAQPPAPSQVRAPRLQARGFLTYLPGRTVQRSAP